MEEIWKDIKGYEGLYKISNYGQVKSFHYYKNNKTTERILKPCPGSGGYYHVTLCDEFHKRETAEIHILVWEYFGKEKRNNDLVIDHIDENKLNNKINNLQLLTQRENATKFCKTVKFAKTSKFVGVSFHKPTQKWIAHIYLQELKGNKYLGLFQCETAAMVAYQKALKMQNHQELK